MSFSDSAIFMDEQELYEQGFQLRCEGACGEAKNIFGQVLESNPDHADTLWQLGLIKGFEGDFDGSIEALKAVVEANPNHVGARFDYAMSLMMIGHEAQACEQFREVLRQDPSHEKAKQQTVFCP